MFNKNGIPEELKRLNNWVCWGKTGIQDGKKKMPWNPETGTAAKAGVSDTWTSFEKAAAAVDRGQYAGVGFEFSPETGITGIDFDHCMNPKTGEIIPETLEWLQQLGSYTERSQSGTGFHVFVKGKLSPGVRNKFQLPEWGVGFDGTVDEHGKPSVPGIEIYNERRYFALTGNQFSNDNVIVAAQEALDGLFTYLSQLYEKKSKQPRTVSSQPAPLPAASPALSDAEIVERAGRAKNGAIFSQLYNGDTSRYNGDHSRADQALCNILAYYTRDPAQIDAIFRCSGLMRDKWDELHGKETYGRITVNKALERVTAHGSSEKAFTPLNWDGTPETDAAACELPPPGEFVESLSREDLLNPDKVRPVFELPAENRAAYIAEIEARVKREKLWNPWQQLAKALKTQQAEQLRAERAKSLPAWAYLDGFGAVRINEPDFIESFTGRYTLVCENGIIYGMDGQIEDRDIRQLIQREIAGYITSDLAAKTDKLLKALKNDRNGTLPPPQLDRIHLQNGTLMLKERVLKPEKEFARNRLAVSYDPAAKCPLWIKNLERLLDPDDIRTLQEFIGYLLIPTNKAQAALFICGDGEEGKGAIPKMVVALLGLTNLVMGKLDTVQDRFGLAGLDGKLAFIDDDLESASFHSTGVLKEIITADKPVSIERKGKDRYQATMYARVLCCGNNFISALYDHSDGFFRRQLLIRVLPGTKIKRKDRDTDMYDKLRQELPGILNWALDGLERLRWNGWNFTVSARSRKEMEERRRESCNVISFMESDFVRWGEDEQVFSKDAYNAYIHWCDLNGEDFVKQRTFTKYLREHYQGKAEYSEHIAIQKIRARGFRGFACVDKWTVTPGNGFYSG